MGAGQEASLDAGSGLGARVKSVVVEVARNRGLSRLLLAYALMTIAEYGEWVVLLIYAYDRGGATTAGLVALVQLLPSMVIAPIVSARGARLGERSLLQAAYAVAAVALSLCAAALLLETPAGVVYGAAVVFSIALGVSRPLHTVMLPQAVRHPDELTAANVATNWCEGVATLAGPALVGALIALNGLGTACAALAGASVPAALLIGAVIPAAPEESEGEAADEGDGIGDPESAADALEDVRAAVKVILSRPSTRTLVSYRAGAAAVEGSIDLLVVVLALRVLKVGPGAVGFLSASFGAGGLAGASCALLLVGRRMALPLAGAALAASLAVAALTLAETTALAAVLVALVGAAVAVQSIAAQTLLQRSTPPDVVVCAFTLIEAMRDGGLALGSLAVPLLVALGGTNAAFAGIAAIALLAVVLTARRVYRIDADATIPVVEIGLLRRSRIFKTMPAPALETLAREARHVEIPGGRAIVEEGRPGDSYYLIVAGEVIVYKRGTEIRRMCAGEGFGEIALIHRTTRTATVKASSDVRLLAIGRDAFLTALDARPQVRASAARVADAHLASTP